MSRKRISYPGGFAHVSDAASFADGDIYGFATDHHGPFRMRPNQASTQVMTIQFAISGGMHYDCGDHDFYFPAGRLLILWPNCHRTIHLDASEHWHSLVVRGSASAFPPVFAIPESASRHAIFNIPEELALSFRQMHRRICREWLQPADAYTRSLRSAMCADWCFTWRRWYDRRKPGGDPRVQTALRAIHEHPSRHYSVDELASLAGCGRTSMATLFVRQVGEPPSRYAEARRMAQAQRLLELSDNRICDIAKQLGYDDQRHFGRRFQAHCGYTPSQWRLRRDG